MRDLNNTDQKLLKASVVRDKLDLPSLQSAYDFLRRNRDLCVRLGERQIRVDAAKLDAFIARGGVQEEEEGK